MNDAAYQSACERQYAALPAEIRLIIPADESWALAGTTRQEWMERETRRRFRLYRVLADGTDDVTGKRYPDSEIEAKRMAFETACTADPVFFIRNCIWTQDPEGKVGYVGDLPLPVFRYAEELWLEPWLAGATTNEKVRRTHDKSRRMLMSIYRMAFELWCFRFLPNSKAWISTDKESKLDKFMDWNSLLGKWRHFWEGCRRYLPWMFPDLPRHTDVNKTCYLRFPEWYEGKRARCEELWGNELIGVLATDPRGGAASRGFGDEASYMADLDKLLDAAESMTRDLTLASSAPPDTANLFWKRRELPGVIHNVAPWFFNPINCEGLRESTEDDGSRYAGQWRGEHTRRWRSKVYDAEADTVSSQELGRNWDIDPMASAGARVFLNWDAHRICAQTDPKDPGWDLYDPNLELQVWYDPGRGDPWAWIWVQIDHKKGEVLIVDYDMGADKTVHYWVPMLLGWPWSLKNRWKTAPEALPWHEVVPWSYDRDRVERIQRWNERRNQRGGRMKMGWGDFYGTMHAGSDLYSVQERLQAYGLYFESVPSNYKVESFLEKSDEILLRTRISGRLVGFRPEGRWPAIDEALAYWRRREKSDTSRPGKPSEPLHDDYSHPCMAFTYGAAQLQMLWAGRIREKGGRPEPDEEQVPDHVRYGGGWW